MRCGFWGVFIWSIMDLQFVNWKKWQGRKAVHPRWFAFSNDFPFNRNFRDFTFGERLTFIYLLCEASRTNEQGRIKIKAKTYQRQINVRASVIISTINKLLALKILVYTTEQNNTKTPPTPPGVSEFDSQTDEEFQKEIAAGIKKLNKMVVRSV
jgi:hypothetical protein